MKRHVLCGNDKLHTIDSWLIFFQSWTCSITQRLQEDIVIAVELFVIHSYEK